MSWSLCYATECEAVLLCHEWCISDEMKALVWPDYVSLKSLEEISTSSILAPAFCAKVAAEGNVELLKWARINGYDWDANACSEAADNGVP